MVFGECCWKLARIKALHFLHTVSPWPLEWNSKGFEGRLPWQMPGHLPLPVMPVLTCGSGDLQKWRLDSWRRYNGSERSVSM